MLFLLCINVGQLMISCRHKDGKSSPRELFVVDIILMIKPIDLNLSLAFCGVVETEHSWGSGRHGYSRVGLWMIYGVIVVWGEGVVAVSCALVVHIDTRHKIHW